MYLFQKSKANVIVKVAIRREKLKAVSIYMFGFVGKL